MAPRALILCLSLAAMGCRGGGAPPPPPSAAPLSTQAAPRTVVEEVDATLRTKWAAAGITPAPRCDDATFLRRVTLDLTGALPSPADVTAFLADASPDKRAAAVERLLGSPRYAQRWADYWDHVLLGPDVPRRFVDRGEMHAWLVDRFERNVAWSEIATDLVTATGTNSGDEDVNGAVNWLLKYGRAPADLAGATSRVFLGVQIQCAQCHDHKTEKWTQADFKGLLAAFARVQPVPVGDPDDRPRKIELRDAESMPRRLRRNADLAEVASLPPRALDGTSLGEGPDRRRALAAWMTRPDNPWFSRAMVNRMWGHLVGRGFVHPIDDLRPSNPAEAPEVLDRLASDFAANGWDVRRLLRTIVSTEAYQLSVAAPLPDGRHALWSRRALEPLAPEVLLDAIVTAAGLEPVMERVAGARVDKLKEQLRRQFVFLFEVDEEGASEAFDGTITQALLLRNGLLVHAGSSLISGNALAEVRAMPGGDEAKIESLWLRTLSRRPTPDELADAVRFVKTPREAPASASVQPASVEPAQRRRKGTVAEPMARAAKRVESRARTDEDRAYEDLLWALLNSSEFAFNH